MDVPFSDVSLSACHRSCKDKCSGGGAGDCEECASGYVRSEEGGECKGQLSTQLYT